jgi:hypothetical protein
VAVLVLFWMVLALVRGADVPVLSWRHGGREQYEMVGGHELPDFATPIVVSDRGGKAHWTVSIPAHLDFPLRSAHYSDMCSMCLEVSGRVNTLRSHNHAFHQIGLVPATGGPDQYFVDVAEARSSGLLPVAAATKRSVNGGGPASNPSGTGLVCESSLTFVLESEDAGIGRTLMLLWISYAWAKQHGRAFFVDDTRWAYGHIQDMFQPPPAAACRRPPRHEILPCPRQARHLVVATETAADVLQVGSSRNEKSGEEGEEARAQARRQLFDLARQGYTDLFRLNDRDASYVEGRVRELKSRTLVPKSKGRQDGLLVGVHVRHGDRHPFEYQYRRSYIPINHYTERASEILNSRLNTTGPRGSEHAAAKASSHLILASDDPLVFELDDFRRASRAQEAIKLASKAAIQQVNPDRHVMHKFIDDTFGWDGGFFAPMFWNLGAAGTHRATGSELKRSPPGEDTTRLRSMMGRAYMMDLAVLADASDFVICTVSAMGCRLLAVMMGWDSAFASGRWINIDGDYGWMAVEG